MDLQNEESAFIKAPEEKLNAYKDVSIQRPFYIIGHNPNTISDVRLALAAGANAIEPDLNVYSNNPAAFCISHFEGDDEASSLIAYLDELHAIVVENAQLALIIFDCKSAVSSSEQGYQILMTIRKHLTHDTGVHIYTIGGRSG